VELASSADQYFAQIVSGLGSGAVLFLIASGLTLIFGALRVVNFAHGSLYMLGAYAAFEFGNAIGTGNVSFWAVLLLSGVAVALLGIVVEVLVFRPIYRRPLLTQLLVTFALVLVIAGIQRKVWGAQGESTAGPPFLSGGVKMFGTQIPLYEFFFMGAAVVVAVTLWLLLYRTELGRMIRAAVSDNELLALTGVNVRLLYTGVFALGCFFAGLAGALVSLQGAIGPDLAVDSIIRAFVVIVLGGLGSLGGAFIASFLVGVAEALGIIWVPPASIAIVFAVLVAVLAVRPQGLFGARVAWTEERAGQTAPIAAQLSTRLSALAALTHRFRQPVAAAASTTWLLWPIGLAGIVLVGLMPVIAGSGDVIRMQQALYLGLLALSLNLLVATTGLVSFGHAMFFAVGAYMVAVPFQQLHWDPLLSFALTPVAGAVAAFVIGLVVLRGQQLYFSLLTLGVGQLIWATAHGWQRILGGSNGITAVFGPDWLNSFTHPDNLYWFVYGCVLVCTLMLYVVTRSPFGDALRGIRENRRRAEFSGLSPKRYELAAFVIAGMFGSVAGGLFVVGETQITSEQIDWRRSALALIVCLIGGTRYFLGPFAGAIFYLFVFDWVIRKTVLYDTVLGLIVLGIALLMPAGLSGALEWALARAAVLGGWIRGRTVLADAAGPPAPEEAEATHLPEAQPVTAGPAGGPQKSAEPLLLVKGVSKRFGGLEAVKDVSFEVRPGRIHAIIAPNGAGKTTLFNVVTGLLQPSSGQVMLDGDEVTRRPAWQLVKRGVGRSFQQTNLFWALSALDNVTLSIAAAQGLTRRIGGTYPAAVRDHARELLDRVGLGRFGDVAANELSHGDQRSLELAAALAVDSRLLLLDEPTAGLSPAETKTAVRLIERIAREQGITVLFVEHDMEVVFGVADWITVLHRGAVLAEGTPEEIRRNPDVQSAYLGPEEDHEDEEVSTLA
jgi:branched-chain amino acid transport system permease protein